MFVFVFGWRVLKINWWFFLKVDGGVSVVLFCCCLWFVFYLLFDWGLVVEFWGMIFGQGCQFLLWMKVVFVFVGGCLFVKGFVLVQVVFLLFLLWLSLSWGMKRKNKRRRRWGLGGGGGKLWVCNQLRYSFFQFLDFFSFLFYVLFLG